MTDRKMTIGSRLELTLRDHLKTMGYRYIAANSVGSHGNGFMYAFIHKPSIGENRFEEGFHGNSEYICPVDLGGIDWRETLEEL